MTRLLLFINRFFYRAVRSFCAPVFVAPLILTTIMVNAESSSPLSVVTFDIPPYSYSENGAQHGYVHTLVETVLKDAEFDFEIVQYPSQRAVRLAQTSANTLIYPLAKTEYNQHEYHWIKNLATRNVSFYQYYAQPEITIDAIEDIDGYSIAIVRGSPIKDFFQVDRIHPVIEVNSSYQGLQMLKSGRVDLLAIDGLVLAHTIDIATREQHADFKLEQFTNIYQVPDELLEASQLYLAASVYTPEAQVQALRQAFAEQQTVGSIIEVAHWWTNSNEQKVVSALADSLAQQGYTWADYSYPGGAGHRMDEIMSLRSSAKNLPHVMQSYMGPAVWEWASRKQLLLLNDVAKAGDWQGRLPPEINRMIQYNGDYIAVPFNRQRVNQLWINQALFNRYEIDIPTSWSAIFAAAEQLKAAGVTPFSMGDNDWQRSTLFENLMLSLGGVDFYRSALIELDPAAFQSAKMKQVMQTFQRIRDYANPRGDYPTWVDSARALAEGKAAMHVMGEWVVNVFEESGLHYGKGGYISVSPPDTDSVFLNNTDVFAFPKKGRAAETAQKTLAGMIMSDRIQYQFNQIKGSVPAIKVPASGTKGLVSAAKGSVPVDFTPLQIKQMEASDSADILPSFTYQQTVPNHIREPLMTVISQLFDRELDSDAAIQKMVGIITTQR